MTRYILYIFCLFISGSVYSQFMLLPSNYNIKDNNIKFLTEISVLPISNLHTREEFQEYKRHYQKVIDHSMKAWFQNNYSDGIIYSINDSIINIQEFKTQILQETPVYDMFKSRPLFGYSGNIPTEGAYIIENANKLRDTYNIEYLVFVSVVSLFDKESKGNDKTDYVGHNIYYAWIIDTETGHIEKEITIKGSTIPNLSKNNAGITDYRPLYHKLDDLRIEEKITKVQKKLKKKLRKF